MNAKNFVIISYPRTGSTFLTIKLHSSHNLKCYSELFHKKKEAFNRSFYEEDFTLEVKKWYGSKTMTLGDLLNLRTKNFSSFLNLVFSSSNNPVGFKIFPGQHTEAMEGLINDDKVKKIFLVREDMLRNFVSYKLAMTTGKWDRVAGQEAELQEVTIDSNEFLTYADSKLGAIEEIEKRCIELGQETLRLSYEEITTELPIDRIGDFLNVDLSDIDMDVDRQKQNPFELRQMVSNFEELEDALKGTRWEQFLMEKV